MGTIRVAWWNLQNLFDTDDDPISADLEFTVEKGWTPEAFAAKKANLAAVLSALTVDGPPELLGVAEVEGDDVFTELLDEVGEPNLRVVRDPGGTADLRGIDVSVAYDQRKLTVVEQRSHVVNLRYPTRDIFEVVFTINETGDRVVVLASHWPSRRLGRYESEPSRIAVAENLAYLVRNHLRFDAATYLQLREADDLDAVRRRWETPILLMGDFNDERSTAAWSTTCRPRASATGWRARPMTSTASRPSRPTTPARTSSSTTLCGRSCRASRAARSSSPAPRARHSPTGTRSSTSSSSRGACSPSPARASIRPACESSTTPASPRPPSAPGASTARPGTAHPITYRSSRGWSTDAVTPVR
ncbi:MAG TPA: hypothetical protein VGJ53_03770 [Micromonosporaceae bacterium]